MASSCIREFELGLGRATEILINSPEQCIFRGPNYSRTWIQSFPLSPLTQLDRTEAAVVVQVVGCLRELWRLRFGGTSCFSSSQMVSHSDRRRRKLGCLLRPACRTP